MDNNLEEYLRKIAEMTFEGRIKWNQTNPSTFSWENSNGNEKFIVTIQKASPPRSINQMSSFKKYLDEMHESYLFQVKYEGSVRMSLSSADRNEFTSILSNIYKGAMSVIDSQSSELLKNILSIGTK